MKRTKLATRLLSVLCAMGLAFCMTGCSNIPKLAPSQAPAPELTPKVDAGHLVKEGTLTIGLDYSAAPFAGESGGRVIGIDADVGAALAQELGRMPDSEEIAESFRWQGDRKITEASIERNKKLFAGNRSVSLDAPFPGARIDRETVAADIIGSDEILPDEEAVLNERKQALEDALSALPRREEIAIRARYGMPREGLDLPVIRDGEEATFDEIAKVFGITHEGARYLVGSAKKRIATGTAPAFRRLREIVSGTGI